jgi:hypothetical protein
MLPPNMTLEAVIALEIVIIHTAIYWALVELGGIMDIVDVALDGPWDI